MNEIKILNVEDDDTTNDFMSGILEKEGYKVIKAYNGVEALEILEKEEFNIAIVNIMMPGMKGFELTEKIKAKYPDIEIILTSGFWKKDKVADFCAEKGVFEFMQKPFKVIEFKEIVNRCVQQVNLKREEVISIYSQKQAIEDGILVDISDTKEVKEAGFRCPVVVTRGVFDLLEVENCGWQDFEGRLWDLLTMAKIEIGRMKKENDLFGEFRAIFKTKESKYRKEREYNFFLTFNQYEGFTIMFPEDY